MGNVVFSCILLQLILSCTSVNTMHLLRRGAELVNSSPEILAFGLTDVSSPIKFLGGLAAALAVLKGSYTKVPEGFVGIRTFNGRAIKDDGEPIHELLEPGGHWVLPLLHDVEFVNRQHQTTVIETTIDVDHPNGFKQYRLGAVTTWGALSDDGGIRPKVTFDTAYRLLYKIDSWEDLEAKVAAVVTKFLIECVLDLEPDERTVGCLNQHADEYISSIEGLNEYGVGILGIEITEFSHAGVIQMGTPSN